ncbi:uncharacterized protein [Nicotiana tomentosiformis]|uniref:uncharacterized protein n=1 Tax=Nicotiana tomentosiformis TaxID=4098 RepID=UPI00388C9413
MALLNAVDKWRYYLQYKHFVVRTNHHNLKYLLEQRVTTVTQQKGLTKLLGLDNEVQYKKGVENRVADALSRQQQDSECHKDNLKEPYRLSVSQFLLGCGHSGQLRTLRRLSQVFYWPRMKQMVIDYVASCDVCLKTKDDNMAYPGLLQPLPIPNQQWLTAAEWWYNTNFHTSLQFTPFEALQQIQQLLKDNLTKAQERMKYYTDKRRSDREFQVGDMVYLKLQPYRQTSLALRKNLKLSSKYYGPYKVLARVGMVAYKLDLPPKSKVHTVFHISLLKKKVGNRVVVQTTLPITGEDGQFLVKSVAILQRQLIKRNNSAVVRVLVQW